MSDIERLIVLAFGGLMILVLNILSMNTVDMHRAIANLLLFGIIATLSTAGLIVVKRKIDAKAAERIRREQIILDWKNERRIR